MSKQYQLFERVCRVTGQCKDGVRTKAAKFQDNGLTNHTFYPTFTLLPIPKLGHTAPKHVYSAKVLVHSSSNPTPVLRQCTQVLVQPTIIIFKIVAQPTPL